MKKVLIVTLYGNFNYGNKFQNYAIQNLIEKNGLLAYTLYISSSNKDIDKKNNLKDVLKNTVKKILSIIYKTQYDKRLEGFKNFSDKYIKLYQSDNYKELSDEFDFVCIGSDQIWNPFYMKDLYFSYAKFSNKAFSYAASFGIDAIPNEYIDEVKDGLENLECISVREEKGAQIVKELVNKEVPVVLDPTLLLTSEEWDEIIEVPKYFPKKKYIFTYFLGNYSKERKEYIEKYAAENDLEIVCLGQASEKKYYSANPGEFIYLLKNSELVITDSFHGSVFSIIYKKPFYAMNREDNDASMNSRIETLLKTFNLTERKLNNLEEKINLKCDFKNIDDILKIEKEKSISYLHNAISNMKK